MQINAYHTDRFTGDESLISSFQDYEGLSFESVNPGGYSVASFDIKRKATVFWEDLQFQNRIQISHLSEVVWEGYIDKTDRSINPDNISIQCLGWSARLNQLGTEDDITAGVLNYYMRDFITDVILADGDIEIIEGDLGGYGYAYPQYTRFEFAPYTTYFDALEKLNAADKWDWGVWNDFKMYYSEPDPTDIKWIVYLEDCSDLTISPNPANLCNYVIVSYTQDGTHQQTTTRQDAASQVKYGVIKNHIDVPGRVTTAGAQQIGDTHLADYSTLRVAAEFTCNRVFNPYGIESPVSYVRAGDNIRLVDWLPTEERLRLGVTDISTFKIKSTSYNHDDATLSVTPTEWVSQVEIALARLEATGY